MRQRRLHPRTGREHGFTLIEVLIGVLLLSMAILTCSAALSQSYRWQIKQEDYEMINITAVSLVNSIVATPEKTTINDTSSGSGELNGMRYSWRCRTALEARNAVQSEIAAEGGAGAGAGRYTVFLEDCSLAIEWKNSTRNLQFYRSRYAPF